MPAISWVLSLLVLKLTRTRRVSHVDDLLLTDLAAALLAGLTTLARRPRSPTTPTPATTTNAPSSPPGHRHLP